LKLAGLLNDGKWINCKEFVSLKYKKYCSIDFHGKIEIHNWWVIVMINKWFSFSFFYLTPIFIHSFTDVLVKECRNMWLFSKLITSLAYFFWVSATLFMYLLKSFYAYFYNKKWKPTVKDPFFFCIFHIYLQHKTNT
jgi:hypothetical protein